MLTRRRLLQTTGLVVTAGLSGFSARLANAASSRTLTAKPGTASITNGRFAPTEIWGYDGQVPGPVLRVNQGERVKIRLRNNLEQPTSIHWHGIRIDNAMDGSPLVQTPVAPGDHFDYDFVTPDAGTYWYHTHTRSFEQLERGLYGMLIVEEPRGSGDGFDDELVLIIDDWLLDKEGKIDAASFGAMMHKSHAGRIGNFGTVNGENRPEVKVRPGARLRVRMLNASNARIVNLKFPSIDGWVIAHDGQPIEPTRMPESIVIAPGQRTDLAVDIPTKLSEPLQLGMMVRDRIYEAATLVSSGEKSLTSRSEQPERLPDNPLLHSRFSDDKRQRVTLTMEGGAMGRMKSATFDGAAMGIRELVNLGRAWSFNGIADMESQAPLFEAKTGETVEIDINNDTAWPHAMHLHGHHFRVIKREGKSVAPGPWRDTYLMQRGERTTIALVADNPGKWLVHCHMAEHAAAGMAGWFRVG